MKTHPDQFGNPVQKFRYHLSTGFDWQTRNAHHWARSSIWGYGFVVAVMWLLILVLWISEKF